MSYYPYREPVPSDFDSDEEWQLEHDAWERAVDEYADAYVEIEMEMKHNDL